MKAHASPRVRSKIVIDGEHQVRTRHFGITQQEHARAIEIVSNLPLLC